MSPIDEVVERVKAQVPALGGRVETAAELAVLVAKGDKPQRVPAAYVLWLGDDAGPVTTLTGLQRQIVTQHIGVVLVTRHVGDRRGGEQLDDIRPLVEAVKAALTGWEPPGGEDALAYRRGRLLSLTRTGHLFAQVDFKVDAQLRV